MHDENRKPGRVVRAARELTDRDLEAIACYADLADSLCDIFDEELAKLEEGQVDALPDIFERKQKIVQAMEIKMPILEGLIDREAEPIDQLKIKLSAMAKKASDVSVRIERIAAATSAVMREINKVQEKHSLSGMYSPDGRKRGAASGPSKRIDESF